MANFANLQPIWSSDLALSAEPTVDWIWQGYIAPGNVTLLTGLWKAGKTTLLALLLARRKHGGKLAGLDVKPGKTLVVTEEDSSLWAQRARRHNFGDQVLLISRPFNRIPSEEQWQALLDEIRAIQAKHAIDLLMIDPLAPFLRDENNAKVVLDYLMPLCELTKTGMAVLATHHPAKAERPLGHSARGSGAILAQVDIVLEMRLPALDRLTRRRRIIGLSRHNDTPRHLLLELNADASDYLVLPDEPEDGFDAHWHILQFIFEDAEDPTRP
jgi:hypothetical protein